MTLVSGSAYLDKMWNWNTVQLEPEIPMVVMNGNLLGAIYESSHSLHHIQAGLFNTLTKPNLILVDIGPRAQIHHLSIRSGTISCRGGWYGQELVDDLIKKYFGRQEIVTSHLS